MTRAQVTHRSAYTTADLYYLTNDRGALAVTFDDGETLINHAGRWINCTPVWDFCDDDHTVADLTPAAQATVAQYLRDDAARAVSEARQAQDRAAAAADAAAYRASPAGRANRAALLNDLRALARLAGKV